jgi:hypothetical protein
VGQPDAAQEAWQAEGCEPVLGTACMRRSCSALACGTATQIKVLAPHGVLLIPRYICTHIVAQATAEDCRLVLTPLAAGTLRVHIQCDPATRLLHMCSRAKFWSSATTRLALQMEVESFYKAQGNEEPSSRDRLQNILAAAKTKPKSFAQALQTMQPRSSTENVGKLIFGPGDVVRSPSGCSLQNISRLRHPLT